MEALRMATKKLATTRAKKTNAGEGSYTSSLANFVCDGHKFRSEEYQCHFELIKDCSFLKERRVQLLEGDYPEFMEEITRRNWRQLAEPMPKYYLKVVLEFYANAWPTDEGVLDKHSKVWGQWIPYDRDAINQFSGNTLILEEVKKMMELTNQEGGELKSYKKSQSISIPTTEKETKLTLFRP
ncbi:hypothetical protein GmHk_18G051782 [Glycine max]|nr:hypothetical protein GmHk_18G051782 [Glycine max]